jgi:hypothetical protein
MYCAAVSALTGLTACGKPPLPSPTPSRAPIVSTFEAPPVHLDLNFQGVYAEKVTAVTAIDDCVLAIDFRGDPLVSNPNLTNLDYEAAFFVPFGPPRFSLNVSIDRISSDGVYPLVDFRSPAAGIADRDNLASLEEHSSDYSSSTILLSAFRGSLTLSQSGHHVAISASFDDATKTNSISDPRAVESLTGSWSC